MSLNNSTQPDDQLNKRALKKIEASPLDRKRAFLRERQSLLRPPVAEETLSSTPPDVSSDVDIAADEASSETAAEIEFEDPLPDGFHKNRIASYRQRQQSSVSTSAAVPDDIEFDAARPAPHNNWVPLGPSVLRQGQAVTRPAVSGRVAGMAVAPGGLRVYVASANGGVWVSDDGGKTWRSTMDAWDLNPTTLSSDSLACGAIAIDQDDPDRVYVGTGEGGAESFFGVGPICSDDGGVNWDTEKTSTPETSLAGSGFYALAVDPADRERVIGATEIGLYAREPDEDDGYHWVRKLEGVFTSVVAARSNNVTTFYAAARGGNVLMSEDGNTWTNAGASFPTGNTWRIGLAVQPNNPNVVYALICRANDFHLRGVWRLDRGDGKWREVEGAPKQLFGDDPSEEGQGWYDLAIAIDPNNINRIYLGGSTVDEGDIYPGSLFSCIVSSSGSGTSLKYQMVFRYIGAKVHADIHSLVFTPGDSNKLWVGCDGGVFYTSDATGNANFEARNLGLATLTMNYLSMHPTEEALIFCGTQDNGTVRYTGEEAWLHSCWGDGGFVVINWNDPRTILRTYNYGIMQRATDGGQGYGSWEPASLPILHRGQGEFYAPLVGAPYNPAATGEADVVAFGGVRLWLSTNFGTKWKSLPNNDVDIEDPDSEDALPQPGPPGQSPRNKFRSIAFASASRIYAGTTLGQVYRYEKSGNKWSRTPLHAAPLLRGGSVTSIAIDPADQSGDSIYITLAGHGNYRHVWRFDGNQWQHRSGPKDDPDARLLDVQHNAIVVDPVNPAHLYVGADIGVWRSTDGGITWSTFSYGLPDAAVLDLQLHASRRLLRAATHGRGVFEYTIDTDTAAPVELYIRDTQLDVGRRPVESGLNDPASVDEKTVIGDSPDIKVDTPSSDGYQTLTNQINFWEFTDVIEDRSDRVATSDQSGGVVINRVYVQVHNRGLTPAIETQVMLLLAETPGEIADLPSSFMSDIQNGNMINTPQWRTVGIQKLDAIRVNSPRVAAFDLPSNILPPPDALEGNADYALLAVLHSASDPYTNDGLKVSEFVPGERKATLKKIRVVTGDGG